MSTPLGALIRSVLTDPETQAAFTSAPEAFLEAHGYTELDPQDLREAFYVMAEGSPPETAGRLVAGGDAIGDADGDDAGIDATAASLVAALGAMSADAEALDPSALDGFDDADDVDDAETDGAGGAETPAHADRGHHSDDDDVDDTADQLTPSGAAEPDEVAVADRGDLSLATAADSELDADREAGGFDLSIDDSVDVDGLDAHLLDTEPSFDLSAPDADLAPLVPDATQPALPDDEVSDGWDDVI